MKITFITYIYPYPDRGFNPGIERVIQEFARELVIQGHDVHVLTTYRNGGTKKSEVENGVHVHRISDTRHYFGRIGSAFSLDFLSINFGLRKYETLLEDSGVVHTFTPIIWWPISTPLVAHYHHWDEADELKEYLYLPTSHKLWLRCYKIANRVVAISEFSASDLSSRGITREKIAVVHNGVNTNVYHPEGPEISIDEWDNILLYVGPLVERKGLSYLIKSLPIILEENPNTGLILGGKGEEKRLANLATELGVREHIRFEGFIPEDDLPKYYRGADIFLFPSLLEGF
jgi:glycosyltransferase involved in cell wall biosynthesis